MRKTLVLVLGALGLLVVGFAGGMYTSSLLHARTSNPAPRQTAAAPELSLSSAMPLETTAPPAKPAVTPSEKPAVTPPATTPRASGTPAGKPSTQDPKTAKPESKPPSGDRQQQRGAAFEQMRAKMELPRLFRNLGRLEELKEPLTPAQAKAILAIMTPLRTQKTLTNDEAKKVLERLQAQLTPAQKDALAQSRERRGRGGDGGRRDPGGNTAGPNAGAPAPGGSRAGRGGDGAPGGGAPRRSGPDGTNPRGPGGGDPAEFAKRMETMNPFYMDGDNPMAQRMAERYQAIFDMLEAKAKD